MTAESATVCAPELESIIELRGVHKSFGGVRALRGVDLAVPASTVIGLAGENGAGKSTLLKVLAGIYAPDSGEVLFDGVAQPEVTPAAARRAGIGSVAQELTLFNHLSVAENILVGQEPLRRGFVDRGRLVGLAQGALDQLGSHLSPEAMVRDLAFADRQTVEIAKALVSNPRLLILDEPTSGLREQEAERLLRTILELKASGHSVIFITHRMSEMFAVCDRFTVLKDGESVAMREAGQIQPDELIRLMVGRELTSLFPEKPDRSDFGDEPLLAVSNFRVPGTRISEIELTVRPGEIVGLAGLAGNGQNELLEAIAGVRRARGELRVGDKRGPFNHPGKALRAGITLVPEDRKTQGLVLPFSIGHNLTLPTLSKLSWFGFISRHKERAAAERSIGDLTIRPPDPTATAAGLSGGNQQKVVIGKSLQASPSVFIFADPTRGIDVGTKREIYVLLRRLTAAHKAILLLSTDLTEIVGICDRALVMSRGRIVAELAGAQITEQNVTRASFGAELES